MTIAEKIQCSVDKTIFTLFKEGVFYKCYNEDAMVFAQKVKAYKVSCKYVKNIDAEVLSLGFPVSEADKGRLSFDMLSKTLEADKYDDKTDKVTFYLKDNIKQGYENWYKEVINENQAQYADVHDISKPATNGLQASELVVLIKNFDLANSTPMQGLVFIHELKTFIKTLS